MNLVTIIIQSDYVVFDDLGQPMAMGETHVVNLTPVIENLISNGQASIIPDPVVSEVQEVAPKPASTTKNSKNQETVSTSPTGEI